MSDRHDDLLECIDVIRICHSFFSEREIDVAIEENRQLSATK